MVASHGQTIHHDPEGHSTTQIGQPAVIAALTGATVVADFRVADMAHGGQGAPLTSTFDWLMLRPPPGVGVRALQNIGGIANVTFVTEAGADGVISSGTSPVAFDTGPGNCLIDLAAAAADPALACDRDGLLAADGRVNEELLDVMLQHPYFVRPAPKTTGREEFSSELFERWHADAEARGCSPNDFVATVTELTARSIARAYHLAPPELSNALTEVVVSGGGGKNPQLMARLVAALRREFGKDVAVRGHVDVLSELVEPGALPAGLTVDDAKEAMVSHAFPRVPASKNLDRLVDHSSSFTIENHCEAWDSSSHISSSSIAHSCAPIGTFTLNRPTFISHSNMQHTAQNCTLHRSSSSSSLFLCARCFACWGG